MATKLLDRMVIPYSYLPLDTKELVQLTPQGRMDYTGPILQKNNIILI